MRVYVYKRITHSSSSRNRISPAAAENGIPKLVSTCGCISPKYPPGNTAALPEMNSFSSYGFSGTVLPSARTSASIISFASVNPAFFSLQITNAMCGSSSGVQTCPISNSTCGYSLCWFLDSVCSSPGIRLYLNTE